MESQISFGSGRRSGSCGLFERAKRQYSAVNNDDYEQIHQQYQLDLNGDGRTDGTFGRPHHAASLIKNKKAEQENTLIVHEGETNQGACLHLLLQDEPTVEVMAGNWIGGEDATVGNDEFDEGTKR